MIFPTMDHLKARTALGITAVVVVAGVAATEGFNGRVMLAAVLSIASLAGVEVTGIIDTLFGR